MSRPDGLARKVERLRAIELFAPCSRKELVQVAGLVDEIDAPAGHVFMREGTPGSECYIIAEGRATVTVVRKAVAELGPGCFFGEIALLGRRPRTATVTAATPMRVFVIGKRDFSSLIARIPSVWNEMLLTMSDRLRKASAAG